MVKKSKILYHPLLPYFICTLASLFYVYDFVIQILPGTIFHDLMKQYNIGAAGLGLLSSFFFQGYMLMQIPCGLLYDRYGPHRLLTLMCFIASAATFLFLATPYFSVAAGSRFFMGVGSAFAYIGALVLALRWLPPKYYALTAGLVQLMGSIGAMMGEAPVAHFAEKHGPFFVTMSISFVGFILTILLFLFIRDYPPGSHDRFKQDDTASVLSYLKCVIKIPQNWAAALCGFSIWAPISVFAGLWAIPFLKDLYHISNTSAAGLASFLWLGVGLGGPVFGWLSSHLRSRRIPLIIGTASGVAVSLVILYVPNISIDFIPILLFIFGAAGSAQAVTFGVVQDNNLPHYSGTAAGFNNMAIVTGGVLLQPIVGILLRWKLEGEMSSQIYNYSLTDYRFALAVLPICFLISFLTALFLIRETHCQPQKIE